MDNRRAANPSNDTSIAPSAQRKKRTYKSIPVACDECRRRKTACDGVKPVCSRCEKHGRTCVYEFDVHSDETRQAAQSRAREDATQQLANISQSLELLKDKPDDEVLRLWQQTLSASNPLAALANLHHQSTPNDKLPSASRSGSSAPRQMLHEDDLATSYPEAYPECQNVLRSVFLDGFTSTGEVNVQPTSSTPKLTDEGVQAAAAASTTARLSSLRISVWTSVQISDADAAELITEFLVTEHLILSLFDTELFIGDLLTGSTRFCSKFLIASLLFTVCQSRAESSARHQQLRAEFLDEVKRQWPAAREIDGALTLAASQLLMYACDAGGEDDLGTEIRAHSNLMWERLNAIGRGLTQAGLYRPALTPEELSAISHVTWSIFNMNMLLSSHGDNPSPAHLPAFPAPTRTIRLRKQDLEDQAAASPTYDSFAELSKLRTIEHQIVRTYNAVGVQVRPVSSFVPLQFVSERYAELLAWAADLDELHQRRPGAPYHVLVLHMWYHTVLMGLFGPFLSGASSADLVLPANKTAKYLFAASLQQLKALVVTLRFKQPPPRNAILWHTGLLQVVKCVLRAAYTATDRLFYFRLCVDSYFALLSTFPAAFEHLKAIVWLAMHDRIVDVAELQSIWKRLRADDRLNAQRKSKAAHDVELDLGLKTVHGAIGEISTVKIDELLLRDLA